MTQFSQELSPPVAPAFRASVLELITWVNKTYSANQPEHCEQIIRQIYRVFDAATKEKPSPSSAPS